jgi:hypothetical protein
MGGGCRLSNSKLGVEMDLVDGPSRKMGVAFKEGLLGDGDRRGRERRGDRVAMGRAGSETIHVRQDLGGDVVSSMSS